MAFEVSYRLQARGTDHALIDTDELDRIYPVPPDLSQVTEQTLRAMWGAFSEQGSRRLILVGVYLDRPSELEWIARAIPNARFTLVRLLASHATLRERVMRREIGSGADAQLERTRLQATAMRECESSVHAVETDGRSVTETAELILERWPLST